MQKYYSGDTAPKSGNYIEHNTSGGQVNTIYIEQGKTLPPCEKEGYYFTFDN